jgi:hypothetical protein
MTYRFDLHARLETIDTVGSPLAVRAAVRAEVHDPVWLLGRQWQLGEHHGSDAAFPALVHLTVTETPVSGRSTDPEDDPRVTPPEVVIESEPEQWWTMGRRVRIGLAVRPQLPAELRSDPTLMVTGARPPYGHLNGTALDGLVLYRKRSDLGVADSVFIALGVPDEEPPDDWVPEDLAYSATFAAGPVTLSVTRHDGGAVDWYSVTAKGADPPAPNPPVVRTSYPTRASIPGGALPRWWQIEDPRLDPGAVAPARTHLARLLVIRAASARSDGWFTAPLAAPIGTLVGVRQLTVDDSMGLTSTNAPALDWALFHVSGRPANELLLWPTVAHPLTAAVGLDVVDIGVDEDANVLWAVEKRVDGSEVVEADPPPPTPPQIPTTGQVAILRPRQFRYVPATDVPQHWHPYVLQATGSVRRYIQGRLADLDHRPVVPRPGPTSRLLQDPQATAAEPAHAIFPDVIPRIGIRIDRRYKLGRSMAGAPLLWIQRSRSPLAAPPASRLRYDVLDPLDEIT